MKKTINRKSKNIWQFFWKIIFYSFQKMEKSGELWAAIAYEGRCLDILERVCCIRLYVSFQRCCNSVIAATFDGTIAAPLSVIFNWCYFIWYWFNNFLFQWWCTDIKRTDIMVCRRIFSEYRSSYSFTESDSFHCISSWNENSHSSVFSCLSKSE